MTKRLSLTLALASCVAALPLSAQAQDVLGSGVSPVSKENSKGRPVSFAETQPEGSALAIVVTGNSVDEEVRLPVDVDQRMANSDFDGLLGSRLEVPHAIGDKRVVLFGGLSETGTPDWRRIGAEIAVEMGDEDAPIAIAGIPSPEAMADVAFGFSLAQYRFDRYKSEPVDRPAQPVVLVGDRAGGAEQLWNSRHAALAQAVWLARDLQNEPANVLYPESFVARTREVFDGVENVSIEVLDPSDMRRLGMGAIVGVGQGSPRGSRLMLITYRGAGGPPLALAGKGITFDTGGITLKSNPGMWEMKGDMSGAAAVTAAVLSLAKSKAPVHVVAAVALAENMPGANAQRPGDVVRTLSGKTIEIRSTDAEGRLVLSDAIEYTVREKQPFALIDIATLTGSVGRALGSEYAGVFAREDAHAEAAIRAGAVTNELVWRLPLNDLYREAIKSDIADIRNSDALAAPGASAGAHFIEHFVPQDLPWIHIDMASVDRATGKDPMVPVGSRGYGVMLLDELARTWRPE